MKLNVRTIYLYLFSFIGLVVIVVGTVKLVNLGIKTFVFPDSERYSMYLDPVETKDNTAEAEQEDRITKEINRNRQRELADSLALIIVGTPLYFYHWLTIQKENKTS